GFRLEATLVVDVRRFTVCVSTDDVLAANVLLPPYTAVMLCGPAVSAAVANVAWPELSVPVPSVVVPSLKVTVPVGVPPLPVTVAVNVTGWPAAEGLTLEVSVAVDATSVTVWVNAADALAANAASPL